MSSSSRGRATSSPETSGGSGLGRETVFAGPAVALYVPPRVAWTAEGRAELAICTAPAEGRLPARLLDSPTLLTRGEGNEERAIANILMEDEPAESLLVTEVVTPRGHWSSYPPHKHDTDDPPNETLLEETYYHRLRPADGFAFQRVYTDDGDLDETIAVADGDTVLVPRGYHPVAAGATARPLLLERHGGAGAPLVHDRRPAVQLTLSLGSVHEFEPAARRPDVPSPLEDRARASRRLAAGVLDP